MIEPNAKDVMDAIGGAGILLWGAAIIGFWLGVFYGIAKRSGTAVLWGFWWVWFTFSIYAAIALAGQGVDIASNPLTWVWTAAVFVWPAYRTWRRYLEE